MARVFQSCARKVSLMVSGVSDATLRGIARFAREHDWHLSTSGPRFGALRRGWRCDGVLVSLPQPAEFLAELNDVKLPCVAFSETMEPTTLPLIAPDEDDIGRLAADHLMERAHRNFACAPLIDREVGHDRLAAFRARLAEHGFPCWVLPPLYACHKSASAVDDADRRRALVSELRRLACPCAIFAFDDSVAMDVVDACRDAGLLIPEDISVLGVGNSILSTTSCVPLSSVDLELEEIGYRAAALLEESVSSSTRSVTPVRVRPKGVVTRVSTDVIAVSDKRVARALSYIAENYPDSRLDVGTVARAVGMSRRNLERSFRQETGRTIHEHIINVRMREASRLLAASSRTKTSDVAALVGLAGERTFFRVFRRYFGMTPKAHRTWTAQARLLHAKSLARPRPLTSETVAPHPLAPGADSTAA